MKVNVLAGALIIYFACSVCCAKDFFISPEGCDKNTGGKNNPFASLEAARNAIRECKQKTDSDEFNVWLEEGIYRRSRTFELNHLDSGTADAPVRYRAINGHNVRVIGGRTIDPCNVKAVTDKKIIERIISQDARAKVKQIDLKALGITDFGTLKPRGFRRPYVNPAMELFIDDHQMRLARWPNEGKLDIGKVIDKGSLPYNDNRNPPDFIPDWSDRGGSFHYDYDRPDHWIEADDIWLSGYFYMGFADDTIDVKSIDREKKIITLNRTHMYGIRNDKEWLGYIALNLLEEIDQPVEYYIDREKGIVYFYPPGNLDNSTIMVSIMDEPLVAMENASYIHFSGITFECTRGIGIYIEKGTSNRIEGCTLRNIGVVAVCIGQGIEPGERYCHPYYKEKYYPYKPISRHLGSWHEHIYENPVLNRNAGTNHGVISCDIYNIGAGGIHLSGGDRKTLTPGGNFVRNCNIHRCNRLDQTYKAGVNIDGVGNRIEHCRIHDAPGTAIYLHGNNHIIQYNGVFNICTKTEDLGAFYIGRDPTESGNIIQYNFWHHLKEEPGRNYGLMFDDGAWGTTVRGNVFYKVGNRTVMIGSGKDHLVSNNIFIDCRIAVHMWSYNKRLPKPDLFRYRLKIVDPNNPPYSLQYPHLATYWQDNPTSPEYNRIEKNVVYKTDTFTTAKNEWATIRNNFITHTNVGFIDESNMNFGLKADSIVYQKIKDFEQIPFDKIGLYKSQHRKIGNTD